MKFAEWMLNLMLQNTAVLVFMPNVTAERFVSIVSEFLSLFVFFFEPKMHVIL